MSVPLTPTTVALLGDTPELGRESKQVAKARRGRAVDGQGSLEVWKPSRFWKFSRLDRGLCGMRIKGIWRFI